MPTVDVLYPHAIALSDEEGAAVLAQITDVVGSNNFSDMSEIPSSGVAPQWAGAHSATPDFRFNTSELRTLLLAMLEGEKTILDLSGDTVTVEYRSGQPHGTRDPKADAGHVNGQMVENACLVVEKISGSKGGIVTARCRLVATITSENDPIVFSAGVSLTYDSEYDAYFNIGPVSINGTYLGGIESWDWDNRCEYEEVMSDGEGSLSYVGLKSTRPRLTIQTRHGSAIATYGSTGIPLTALKAFLRAKKRGGVLYALTDTRHIKFGASEGWVAARSIGDSLTEVTVDCVSPDDDTDPYTLNVGVAIS